MATLVLGLAGAYLGSGITVFGMSGASLGFSLGSYLGGFLEGPTKLPAVYGPRLADLKFTTSTLGTPIPVSFGTDRIAGNVFWAQNIKETANTTTVTSRGKGGGKKTTQTQTTYSYSCSFAVGLCAGPILGVRRIWANGTLIYNNTSGTINGSTAYASASFTNAVRIYPGDSAQTADPLIQATQGSGANTPAFRNLAYIVFDTMQLAQFGNRIPNIECEVVSAGSNTQPNLLNASNIFAGDGFVQQIKCDQGVVDSLVNISFTAFQVTYTRKKTDLAGNVLASSAVTTSGSFGSVYLPKGNWLGLYLNSGPVGKWGNFLSGGGATTTVNMIPTSAWKMAGIGFVISSALSVGDTCKLYLVAVDGVNDIPVVNPLGVYSFAGSYGHAMFGYSDGTYFYVADHTAGSLYQFDASLNLIATWTYPAATYSGAIVVYQNLFYIGKVPTFTQTLRLLPAGGGATTQISGTGLETYSSSVFPTANGLVVGTSEVLGLTAQLSAGTVTLGTIITSLGAMCGLAPADLDVSASTQTVKGFTVARQMTGRAAIEALMPAFYFDAVETSNVLRFVNRGGAAVVAIPDSDVAARTFGAEAPEPVLHTRLDETQLPSRVEVLYKSYGSDYAQGAQSAERKAARALQQVQLQLPIVMADADAAQAAEINCFSAWVNRDTYKLFVGPEYLYLDPADVVTVGFGGVNRTMRLTKTDEFVSPGVIALEGVAEDSNSYSSNATGSALPARDQTISVDGPTDAYLLDIPLLRDQDDFFGLYLAMCGYTASWPGGDLFGSPDGGATYSEVLNSLVLAPGAAMGVATTALGARTKDFDTFDWANTVTVSLVSGTLASTTRDNIINSYANTCVVGSEIIQFLNATLVGTKTYTLSGLLRGRLGTRRNDASHAANENFALLDLNGGIRRFRDSPQNLNAAVAYKAVTLGATLQDTSQFAFTDTGVAAKPLEAVDIAGGRNFGGDLIVAWNRQTRYQNVIHDYVDAPLGEASESYEVDILSAPGGTVKRTIPVASPTFSYTAAQQTTDFGSPQASISFNIYQLSAVIGRGFPAAATR